MFGFGMFQFLLTKVNIFEHLISFGKREQIPVSLIKLLVVE